MPSTKVNRMLNSFLSVQNKHAKQATKLVNASVRGVSQVEAYYNYVSWLNAQHRMRYTSIMRGLPADVAFRNINKFKAYLKSIPAYNETVDDFLDEIYSNYAEIDPSEFNNTNGLAEAIASEMIAIKYVLENA